MPDAEAEGDAEIDAEGEEEAEADDDPELEEEADAEGDPELEAEVEAELDVDGLLIADDDAGAEAEAALGLALAESVDDGRAEVALATGPARLRTTLPESRTPASSA